MEIVSARGAQWANAEHTEITLFVTFDTVGEVHFGASADDPERHGAELFSNAVAGRYGPIAEYIPPVQTPDQVQTAVTAALQALLDSYARGWGYDSILSAVSYASSTNSRFKSEALALLTWRDQVWAWAESQQTAIAAGAAPVPTDPGALIAQAPSPPRRPTS